MEQNVLNDARQRMNLERQSCDSSSEDIAPTKRLDQTKCTDSYLALMNYLRNRKIADGKLTIDYVVSIDKPLGWLAATHAERLLYGAALTDPYFVKDSQEVCRIVKQWNLNTTNFLWVHPFDR